MKTFIAFFVRIELVFLFLLIGKATGADLLSQEKLHGMLNMCNGLDLSKSCISQLEWNELNLDGFVSKIDKTVTQFGRWGLKKALVPTTHLATIRAQQDRLKALQNDEQLQKKIESLLTIIKDQQDVLLSYCGDSGMPSEDRTLYYSWLPHIFNEDQQALDLSFLLECSNSLLGLVSLLMTQGVIDTVNASLYNLTPGSYDVSDALTNFVYAAAHKEQVKVADLKTFLAVSNQQARRSLDESFSSVIKMGKDIDSLQSFIEGHVQAGNQVVDIKELSHLTKPASSTFSTIQNFLFDGIKKGLLAPLRSHDPRKYAFNDEFKKTQYLQAPALQGMLSLFSADTTAGDKYFFMHEGYGVPKPLAIAISAFLTVAYDVTLFMRARGYYSHLKTTLERTDAIAKKVRSVSVFAHACKELALLLRNHDAFASWQVTQNLVSLIETDRISLAMHKLLGVLEECRGQSGAVYSRGAVLFAHHKLHQIIDEFVPALQAVAHVDALQSVAQVIKETSESRPWCFADFSLASSPRVEGVDFWCPLVHNEPVVNSISCTNNALKMVITGPNGGGKSTVMKSIAYNVILAQSLGIASAQSWNQGLFTYIKTALDPKEDITRGLSTYMAQKQRMNTLRTNLLTSTEHQLILIDEPYRGTVQDTSESLLYEFCRDIAHAPALVLLATHFEKPTFLESQLPDAFVNYQCLFAYDSQSSQLTRTFKVVRGSADWWFHDEHMRSMYLRSLEEEMALESYS